MIESIMTEIINSPFAAGAGLVAGYLVGTLMQKRKMRKRGMGGMNL